MVEGRRRRKRSDEPAPQVMAQWTEEQRREYYLKRALDLPLAEVPGLSTRSVNTLESEGILLVRELLTKKVEELLSYKNLGETTLTEIKNSLKKLGVKTPWKTAAKKTRRRAK